MLKNTLERLCCPSCQAKLNLKTKKAHFLEKYEEAVAGTLLCESCHGEYPILAGIPILVQDPQSYLIEHVKGISKLAKDDEIPKSCRRDYLEAKAELAPEHIEEDLEAERVVSLYLMNHILKSSEDPNGDWWKPQNSHGSPEIASLVKTCWDRGPLAQISKWIESKSFSTVIELGCGVGSLSHKVDSLGGNYLGVDSSFLSVALARHLALQTPYAGELRIPADLLDGPVSRKIKAPRLNVSGRVDFVVGEIEAPPAPRQSFDLALALNAIDMLPDPSVLPALQSELLVSDGTAIQCGPYIWHEIVSRELRERLPKTERDSASAVRWLYEQAGLAIEREQDHIPWLFFKHIRQVELYSVHLLQAKKKGQ